MVSSHLVRVGDGGLLPCAPFVTFQFWKSADGWVEVVFLFGHGGVRGKGLYKLAGFLSLLVNVENLSLMVCVDYVTQMYFVDAFDDFHRFTICPEPRKLSGQGYSCRLSVGYSKNGIDRMVYFRERWREREEAGKFFILNEVNCFFNEQLRTEMFAIVNEAKTAKPFLFDGLFNGLYIGIIRQTFKKFSAVAFPVCVRRTGRGVVSLLLGTPITLWAKRRTIPLIQ